MNKAQRLQKGLTVALITVLSLGIISTLGKMLNDKYDWIEKAKDLFVKPGETSEDPITSEDLPSSENPSISSEDIPVTSEGIPSSSETVPGFTREDLLALPQISSFYIDTADGHNWDYFGAKGLSKRLYKNVVVNNHGPSGGTSVNLTFNSIKFDESYNALKFGFPTTVTELHTTNPFSNAKYSSYMIVDGIFGYTPGDIFHISIYNVMEELDIDFSIYVRTDDALQWTPIYTNGLTEFVPYYDLDIAGGYVQFGFAFETVNKSTAKLINYLNISNQNS